MTNERFALMTQPDQPDHVIQLIRDIHDRVERLDHLIRGNGDDGLVHKISHVERTANENLARINRHMDGNESTARIRWHAIGQVAIALAAITSLVLHVFGS